jgi:flavin-dependent dehydrogenase
VGEGVNMAMLDALMLARSIIKHCAPGEKEGDDAMQLEVVLEGYEQMFERGQDYTLRCIAREKEFFSENAGEDFIHMINAAMQSGDQKGFNNEAATS